MLKRDLRICIGVSGILIVFLLLAGVNMARAQTTPEESDINYPAFNAGGFLQQQFIGDGTPDSPARFSIHRSRVGVTGQVNENISLNLIGGFTEPPNNTPRLVNAFIDFDLYPLLQIRTGQFLLPFGLEGPQPIPLNPAIERATATRRLNTFTMFRDVGLQLSGNHSRFNYAIAVVNGAGANQVDQIKPKDIMGRIGVDLAKDLTIGFSGHMGQYQPNAADNESRFRTAADISYEPDLIFIRSEYIFRKDDQPTGGSREMNGGYLLGGYQVNEDVEAIARYEYYTPDTAMDDNHFTAFTIGANYYFIGNTRLSANYEFRNDQLNPDLGNLFTVQMQVTL